MRNSRAKTPVSGASAVFESAAHRVDAGFRPGGFRAAETPKLARFCTVFSAGVEKGTKQFSVDSRAASLDPNQPIDAGRMADSTAVSRRSAPGPRASRRTGRRISGRQPASAGARFRPRASCVARPCGEPLVWSTGAPSILRIPASHRKATQTAEAGGGGGAGDDGHGPPRWPLVGQFPRSPFEQSRWRGGRWPVLLSGPAAR